MEKQKKNNSGITLVALVVSIIVMLVLAGVSLNATIGENGIVTRAQEAALKQKMAEELENLNLELAKLNIDTISTDETMAIQDIASYLVGKETIDSFVTTSAGQIAAGIDTATGNKYFFGVKGDNTYRITRGTDGLLSAELTTYSSGGDIPGGYALITADSFANDDSLSEEEKGKFTITSDAEVVFMDTISGALSIYVKSGVHATVGIYAKMELTNKNISRSAIDIEPGGILDMYIGEDVEVTVNSGYATEATQGSGQSGTPGYGGYAGIHVPWKDNNNNNQQDSGEYATLNIFGDGSITAVGGNASTGKDSYSGDFGGPGGGGAGAGIGGNGGNGGYGAKTVASDYATLPSDGFDGESCGQINIHGKNVVTAIGGAGGSGGNYATVTDNSGTGAGGYPAAGIGGGGAGGGGGNHINGAGGYSAGLCEDICSNKTFRHVNGRSTYTPSQYYSVGGSYFDDGKHGTAVSDTDAAECGGHKGGQGPGDYQATSHNPTSEKNLISCYTGSGGAAGKGGIIKVSKTATIYAYNGNECTLSEYNSDKTKNDEYYYKPLEIYIQNGEPIDIYMHNGYAFALRLARACQSLGITANTTWKAATGFDDYTEYVITKTMRNYSCDKSGYKNTKDNSIYGVGSGAGYIEIYNGTYTQYNEDSNGNFTTVYTGE